MIDPETWSDITSPKESHFPYVKKCQQCGGNGRGFFENDEACYFDDIDYYKVALPYLEDCPHCKGRGWTIPTEWFGH